MTEKLFEKDSYCRKFTSVVKNCTEKDGFFFTELEKTAFFPEGGGQAPDRGTIDGIEVLDVQEKDGTVYHKTAQSLEEGKTVTGEIDWELRFSRMQSHSGEHIVSGVVNSLFGYTNVGFHMSEAVMTVDFSGPLSAQDIEKVEIESNKAIYRNADIYASYPTKEELENIDYRSKIEPRDGIRLIYIDGIDCCACCAPHVAKTGEVGVIKIISFCPHKKGTRLEMLAGIHAFEDYAMLHGSVKNVMAQLSAARTDIPDAVSKLTEIIYALRGENKKMSEKLAFYEINPVNINDGVYVICENLSYDSLRFCSNSLIEKGIKKCILFSRMPDESYIYVVSSTLNDVREMVKAINDAFSGKGGGKDNYAQGKIAPAAQEHLVEVSEALLDK